MISLLKMNLKLLLRNKGFLFFLLVTPIVSAIILNTKMEHSMYGDREEVPVVIELDKCTERAVKHGDTSAYIVKVYDGAKTELSEYVLEELVKSEMFSVCRCDVREMMEEEVLEQAKKDAFDDRAGVLLYLKADFDQAVLNDNLDAGMQLYAVSEDERGTLFEEDLTDLFGQIRQAQKKVGADSGKIIEMLETIAAELPEKKIVSLAGKKDIELTELQVNQKAKIGYAFAIITLGFLFCGVFVAHTVIEEKNNKVFTRVMLSRANHRVYFLSKFVVAFVISLMQTFVLAACIFGIRGMEFGINKFSFLLVIFLLGLIFSTLSLMVGVLLGDVMNANYAVFAIWSISALLAGLYFSLDDTTPALKALSYLMPQKWFLYGSELLLVGDKTAYSVLLCITAAYLIFIFSVGSVGLKMKRSET